MNKITQSTQFAQFIKYACVGVLNTLVTLVFIFVCKSVFGINPLVSNAIGYIVGVINSFLWNKNWVFKSSGSYTPEAIRFIVGFLVCYGLQLLTVWLLSYKSELSMFRCNIAGFVLSGYGVATLIGNVVYTLSNFAFNKLITFRRNR
ncbi:MAG: GtrA family protein [Muribaculum sp.]|nr:GtrA family protein [Muribaculaceae bacterium]MCM1081296.1 GtrA family protein [Muribaculum sp.]